MHMKKLKSLLKQLDPEDLKYIEILNNSEIEVFVQCDHSYDTFEESEKHYDKVKIKLRELGINWGGVRTGCGAWILKEKMIDMGDWNDPSSKWHY